ncbi:MAG: radical SAM protein [Clostridia bacterium]|nr:radical SAM protein [Clostridia bacterium]
MEKAIRRRFGKRAELSVINYNSRSLYETSTLKRRALKLLSLPAALFRLRAHILPNVEMDVTSRCTLNCKECSHLIPHHRKSGDYRDYGIEELIENVDLLLPLIDECLRFRVIGGEPLMHKQLDVLLHKLAGEKKIRHIQIATNGTIVPREAHLAAMRHPKVSVYITDYGAYAPQKDAVLRALREGGVHVRLSAPLPRWRSIGGFEHRGYTGAQMAELFEACDLLDCKSLHGGKLYLCPRAFHGSALGVIPKNDLEYIDLRKENRASFFRQLNRLYDDPAGLTACYYCTGGSLASAPEVPCAEQDEF